MCQPVEHHPKDPVMACSNDGAVSSMLTKSSSSIRHSTPGSISVMLDRIENSFQVILCQGYVR